MRGYFLAIPTYWTYPGGKARRKSSLITPRPWTRRDAPPDPGELNPLAGGGVEVGVVVAATARLWRRQWRPGPEVIGSPRSPPGKVVCGLASQHPSGLLPDPRAGGVVPCCPWPVMPRFETLP